MNVRVKIKKASPNVNLPKYQSELAAGFDIEAYIEGDGLLRIAPGERELIRTGLHFQVPPNFELQLRPRSGLALKHGISLTNSPATIDADYNGEVKVILENRGDRPFVVENGDRICQALIKQVERASFVEVNELGDTHRGEKGFGSTGIKAAFDKAVAQNGEALAKLEDGE
jgi:dUTP pyrophosphatase